MGNSKSEENLTLFKTGVWLPGRIFGYLAEFSAAWPNSVFC